MKTECPRNGFEFQPLGRRGVVAKFDGGAITSDAGGILLRELESRTGILHRFADCFTDHRDPELIEHSVLELVKQRTFGLCLGYEDLNDHDAATGGLIETLTFSVRSLRSSQNTLEQSGLAGGTIRFWRCWSERRTLSATTAAANGIAAKHSQARAR